MPRNPPNIFFAAYLIEINGLIKINALGLNCYVKKHEGPLPRDLPNRIIFSFEYPRPPELYDFIICL
jgi:hypothetical protein